MQKLIKAQNILYYISVIECINYSTFKLFEISFIFSTFYLSNKETELVSLEFF